MTENEQKGQDKQCAAPTFTKSPRYRKFVCLSENELQYRNEQSAVFSFGKDQKILAEIVIEQNINAKCAKFVEKIKPENIFAYSASRR